MEQIFIARCPPASPGTTFATASTSSSPPSSSSAAAISLVLFCVESWGTSAYLVVYKMIRSGTKQKIFILIVSLKDG